jgi:copper chaperone NosL
MRIPIGRWLVAASWILLPALVACERLDRPVDPVWGKEPCGHCAMLVGDRRYAAEVVASGERRFFDDIGCYVLWAAKHEKSIEHAWVRDAEADRWVDARGARYVSGARTPMDFGFEARSAASGGGLDGVDHEGMRAAVFARRDRARSTP